MSGWLSFGGGRNSMALAIMICEGQLPQYKDARILFADTLTERPETYRYIEQVAKPYLCRHGKRLEMVRPTEGVYERWYRFGMTGSRKNRSCTEHAKIRPMQRYIKAADPAPVKIIGIDAGEAHRAGIKVGKDGFPAVYPLVELGIDLRGCLEIIRGAGLPVPVKSGCWCCPFARVGEVLALSVEQLRAVSLLETRSLVKGYPPRLRNVDHFGEREAFYPQLGDKPAPYWMARKARAGRQMVMDLDEEDSPHPEDHEPCACYDGWDG